MKKTNDSELLATLEARFTANTGRHTGIDWADVRARLEAHRDKLAALAEMERTGGEPDVIGRDGATGEYLFCDCAKESPAGRRGLCYDGAAQASRKERVPDGNAVDMARAMGVRLLTENEYRELQTLGAFDEKTSSWIATDDGVRGLGGALFADRRYGRVFVYHNGAESYYAARGFRAILRS